MLEVLPLRANPCSALHMRFWNRWNYGITRPLYRHDKSTISHIHHLFIHHKHQPHIYTPLNCWILYC
jgi:hypothetical protein